MLDPLQSPDQLRKLVALMRERFPQHEFLRESGPMPFHAGMFASVVQQLEQGFIELQDGAADALIASLARFAEECFRAERWRDTELRART